MEQNKQTMQDNKNKGGALFQKSIDKVSENIINKISENLYRFAVQTIKSKFGMEMYFNNWDSINFRIAEAWLYNKNPRKYNKHTKKIYGTKPNKNEPFTRDLTPCSYFIKLEKETATYCYVKCEEEQINNEKITWLVIYIFGKRYYKYYKELMKDIRNFMFTNDKLLVMNCNRNGDGLFYRIERRDFSTIFLDKKIKEQLINYIHKWKINRDLFVSRGLNYKSGILLYGEPGTGKTSIAKAIASELKCTLLVIDMTNICKINIPSALKEAAECSVNSTVVVLLEDIDCIVGKRDNKANISQDQKKSLQIMLQLLDGVNEVSDVIFVATTNHYDKLDWALIRPSRFDIKLEIGKLNRKLAIEMCNSFKVNPDELLPKDLAEINPSELQDKILKHIMNVTDI